MTAPPIGASTRYIDAGATRVYWVATIAVTSAPTRVELDGGTDLSPEVAEAVGFNLSSETVSNQGINQDFMAERPGSLQVDRSGLLMYADQVGDDIRSLLSRDTQGHLVFLHGGDVPGHLMDVWPVTVAAVSKSIDVSGEPASVYVQCTVHDDPVTDVEVP